MVHGWSKEWVAHWHEAVAIEGTHRLATQRGSASSAHGHNWPQRHSKGHQGKCICSGRSAPGTWLAASGKPLWGSAANSSKSASTPPAPQLRAQRACQGCKCEWLLAFKTPGAAAPLPHRQAHRAEHASQPAAAPPMPCHPRWLGSTPALAAAGCCASPPAGAGALAAGTPGCSAAEATLDGELGAEEGITEGAAATGLR